MNFKYKDSAHMDTYENEIKSLREEVIGAIAESMNLYGITLSNAHLYGTLLFSDKPMTLDEMGEALEMSKTSMSTGVRSLLHLNMVNKIWKRGARKDHYEVESDWHQNFIDYFDIEWRDTATNCIQVLKKTLKKLKDLEQKDLPEGLQQMIESDAKIVIHALDYYDWLLRFIDFLKSNEIFAYVPKREDLES